MDKLKAKIIKMQECKYMMPIILVAFLLSSFFLKFFSSNNIHLVSSVIILVVWTILLILLNFNSALLIMVSVLPLRDVGVYLSVFNIGLTTCMFSLFIAVSGIKYIVKVLKKEEKIRTIPLILCVLCGFYGFVNFEINYVYKFIYNLILFASFYIFYVNAKDVNVKQVSYYYIFALIVNVLVSFAYAVIFKESIFMFGGRFQALCLNPNTLQVYTTLSLVVLVFLFLKQECSFKLFFLLYFILSVVGFLTLSKAFLVCYMVISIYLLVIMFKKSKVAGLIFVMTCAVCACFVLIVMGEGLLKIVDRFTNAVGENFLDKIFTGRISVWQVYIKSWAKSVYSIIFGYGVTIDSSNLIKYATVPHNDYIWILYKYGVIGTILIVAMLISFIKYSSGKKNFKISNILPFGICLLLSIEECIIAPLYLPIYIICVYFLFYKKEDFEIMDCNSFKMSCKWHNVNSVKDRIGHDIQESEIKPVMLSIIIPVYNAEKYLERCVESICSQKLDNVEIILVNDGSKDNSGQLAESLAKQHTNIKVIHKENGGVSSARNCGIDCAKGEYVSFIDSDDYVNENFDKALKTVIQLNKDIVCFSYMAHKNGGVKHIAVGDDFNNKVLENYYSKIVSNSIYNSVWNKIFNLNFIKSNNIKFDENLKIAEDLKFVMNCFVKGSALFCDIPYYNYEINDTSVMKNISFKKICDTLSVCKYGCKILSKIEDRNKKRFISKLVSENLLSVFSKIGNYNEKDNMYLINELAECKKYIRYGSSLNKKLVVLLIKIFGIKLVAKFFIKKHQKNN